MERLTKTDDVAMTENAKITATRSLFDIANLDKWIGRMSHERLRHGQANSTGSCDIRVLRADLTIEIRSCLLALQALAKE